MRRPMRSDGTSTGLAKCYSMRERRMSCFKDAMYYCKVPRRVLIH